MQNANSITHEPERMPLKAVPISPFRRLRDIVNKSPLFAAAFAMQLFSAILFIGAVLRSDPAKPLKVAIDGDYFVLDLIAWIVFGIAIIDLVVALANRKKRSLGIDMAFICAGVVMCLLHASFVANWLRTL